MTTYTTSTTTTVKTVTPLLTSYIRLTVYSYLSTEEQLLKVAVLNKATRRQLLMVRQNKREQYERSVKIIVKGEETLAWPVPRYIFDFADRLSVQTVTPFKRRGQVLESLFREMPSRFNDFSVKLMTNELPPELVNQVVKRELKFQDILLYNVTAEYSDKMDSMLMSSRSLRMFRCCFRQIFPKPITNDTVSEIELLQLEEVDMSGVKGNQVFKADRLKALSVSKCSLKQRQLGEITSN